MTASIADRPDQGEVLWRHRQRVPVDIEAIAKDLGIAVAYTRSLPHGLSGKLTRKQLEPGLYEYTIHVNATESSRRQRFTVAHELAHFLLHRDLMGDEIADDTMYRSALSDYYERQANRMAAELLLPQEAVRSEYRKNPAIAPLAVRFGVSTAAMRIRLEELGIRA